MADINGLLTSYAKRAAEVEHEGTSVGHLAYIGLLAQFLTEAYPLVEAEVRAKIESEASQEVSPPEARGRVRTKTVTSMTGGANYVVSWREEDEKPPHSYACTCPDFQYRSPKVAHDYWCKHIYYTAQPGFALSR
jgi:hypothetical protein